MQEENLDVHDTNASWPNGGYYFDHVEGQNNMNEEWFGIVAKGHPDQNNLFDLYPRAAYFLLKDAYTISPYAEGVTDEQISAHFDALTPSDYDFEYTARVGLAQAQEATRFQVRDIQAICTPLVRIWGRVPVVKCRTWSPFSLIWQVSRQQM